MRHSLPSGTPGEAPSLLFTEVSEAVVDESPGVHFVMVIDALQHRSLFARAFRDPNSCASWLVFLKAHFGLPMSNEDLEVYRLMRAGYRMAHESQITLRYLLIPIPL